MVIRLLARCGIVRVRDDGTVRWPFRVDPWWLWKAHARSGDWFAVFRNRPGVVKWREGRLLPRRWGFRVLGFEFGDRG